MMSIKGKLLVTLVFICTLLGIHASLMVRSYLRNNRQAHIVDVSLGDLYGVSSTRSAILTQIMYATNYRLSGKEDDERKYKESGREVGRAHRQWIDAIERSKALGQDKSEEEDRAWRVKKKYREATETISKAFTLGSSGKILEAYVLLEHEVEPWVHRVLINEIDGAVAREIEEVDEAYEEVSRGLASMPWGVGKGTGQVKTARVFLDYFLVANRTLLNVKRGSIQLMDYLLSGEEGARKEFEELAIDGKRAFQDWLKVIQNHAQLGGEEKSEALRVLEVEKKHNEYLGMAERAIELKKAGKREEFIALVEHELEPFLEEVLFPNIIKEIARARTEIEGAQNRLHGIILSSRAGALILLALLSSIIGYFFIRMIREIIISLENLRSGTEIIGTGKLEHRIGLNTKDELGQLSSSFDRMAAALQHSRDEIMFAKEYTDNILRSMSDMLVVISPDGIIQTANETMCTLLDYGEDELMGKSIDSIFLEDLPFMVPDARNRGWDDTLRNLELTCIGKNGRRIPVSFSSSVMRNDNGDVEGIVCVALDITKRKEAEESLIMSENKFRKLSQQFHTLLDAIPDALLLLNSNLQIQWANNGAIEASRRKNMALIGHHCFEVWHQRFSPCKECHVLSSFRSGKEESAQYSTADGKYWDVRAIPLKDEDGRVTHVIQIAVDITEKRTLQAEALQAAHLASLGELAAGVAHEINNPINSIINYAQILIDEFGNGRPGNDFARRIVREGDRISNIVRSLLSFARVSDEDKSETRVSEVLSSSLALTEAQIRKDGILLKVSTPPDLPEIMAHAQQIEQVFLNIISNARYALLQKYPGTSSEKVLEIVCQNAAIESSPHVRVTFSDRGTGIPSDIVDKVIEPFFSTKPRGAGTGLGLSISHGIISDHGGRLKIDSREGEYTRVTVDLPARRDQ